MGEDVPGEVTRLLRAAGEDTRQALDQLIPIVYERLRCLASAVRKSERADNTLDATALVHEAYLRLVRQTKVGFHNRAEFFAVAAKIMRRILIDHARAQRSAKRGGKAQRGNLDEVVAVFERSVPDLERLGVALDELSQIGTSCARGARVVELRFFGGLSLEEAAGQLGVTARTAERDWRFARAWLRDRLESPACD